MLTSYMWCWVVPHRVILALYSEGLTDLTTPHDYNITGKALSGKHLQQNETAMGKLAAKKRLPWRRKIVGHWRKKNRPEKKQIKKKTVCQCKNWQVFFANKTGKKGVPEKTLSRRNFIWWRTCCVRSATFGSVTQSCSEVLCKKKRNGHYELLYRQLLWCVLHIWFGLAQFGAGVCVPHTMMTS